MTALTARAPNTMAFVTPGWLNDVGMSLVARIWRPTKNDARLVANATGKAMAAKIAALATRTPLRPGMAVNVTLIIPDVLGGDGPDRERAQDGGGEEDADEAVLVGSKSARWAALIVSHWLTWATQMRAARATEISIDPPT